MFSNRSRTVAAFSLCASLSLIACSTEDNGDLQRELDSTKSELQRTRLDLQIAQERAAMMNVLIMNVDSLRLHDVRMSGVQLSTNASFADNRIQLTSLVEQLSLDMSELASSCSLSGLSAVRVDELRAKTKALAEKGIESVTSQKGILEQFASLETPADPLVAADIRSIHESAQAMKTHGAAIVAMLKLSFIQGCAPTNGT